MVTSLTPYLRKAMMFTSTLDEALLLVYLVETVEDHTLGGKQTEGFYRYGRQWAGGKLEYLAKVLPLTKDEIESAMNKLIGNGFVMIAGNSMNVKDMCEFALSDDVIKSFGVPGRRVRYGRAQDVC